MTQYIRLQDQHIQEISKKYRLKVFEYLSIEQGFGNTNYLLRTNNGRYVLTLFELDYARVLNLSKLLCNLEEVNFPTTRIQRLPSGETLTYWGGKPLLLKHYIPGGVLENLSEKMMLQVGAAIARLHEMPIPEFLPARHAYGLETFPRVMNTGIDVDYEYWLAKKHADLKRKLPEMLPRRLIHGDVFYDNVLFDDGDLIAIIDFEEACCDFTLFDLGMAIVGICADGVDINLVKARALLKGYQNVNALSSLEKEFLLLFIEYAAIATSTWRYWKYNIDTPIDSLADKHWEMVRIAKNAAAISNESFLKEVLS